MTRSCLNLTHSKHCSFRCAPLGRSKPCSRCKLVKVLDCFHKGHSQCKDCHKITARESFRRKYAESPQGFLARIKAWREANRDKWRIGRRAYKARMRAVAWEEATQ